MSYSSMGQAQTKTNNNMESVIVYFTYSGNTELAASGAAMFCTRNHLPPASFAMVNCSSAASGTTRPPISGTSFINPA